MSYARLGLRLIARLGYVARGLVYIAVGVVALQSVWRYDQARDVHATIVLLQGAPGGRGLLLGLAAGLAAFAAWRALQALLDVDHHGWGPVGLGVRMALLVSTAINFALAWGALKIAAYQQSGDGGQPIQRTVDRLLAWPYGVWLVVGLGAVFAIAAGAHGHKAATGGFWRWFDAPSAAQAWIGPVARAGLFARGLVFAVIAGFIVAAGLTYNPETAHGLAGVFSLARHQIFGRVLLVVLATGLLAFGIYSLIEAWVRRVGLGKKPLSALTPGSR